MHVVTVTFVVKPDHIAVFDAAMIRQAENSLRLESGCHRFDVCKAPDDPTRTFLYEIYTDATAFRAHLASDHFKSFDATVQSWLATKTVEQWNLSASPH